MMSARKSGFRPPPLSTCVQMSLQTSPLVDVHIPSEKNDPFSRKFFGFWVSCRQIFYISSAKISDDLLLVFSFKKIIFSHVKRNFFNYLCGRSHAPDLPSPFHMRPHWPEPSLAPPPCELGCPTA